MSADAHRFRHGLLIFDAVTIGFLIVSSFLQSRGVEFIDAIIRVLLALDFAARLWIAGNRTKMIASPVGILDILMVFGVSLFLRLVQVTLRPH